MKWPTAIVMTAVIVALASWHSAAQPAQDAVAHTVGGPWRYVTKTVPGNTLEAIPFVEGDAVLHAVYLPYGDTSAFIFDGPGTVSQDTPATIVRTHSGHLGEPEQPVVFDMTMRNGVWCAVMSSNGTPVTVVVLYR